MKKITLLLPFLFISIVMSGQKYVDMTDELTEINGHFRIDGNELQAKYNTREQIIIRGVNMTMSERSSFLFTNVIVQLSGKIKVLGPVKPALKDSYIFCKDSGPLQSRTIIEVKNFDDVAISDVEYIKNLEGDPSLKIYDIQGKMVFKGTKSEAKNFKLPISQYDVKVIGVEFKEEIMFVSN